MSFSGIVQFEKNLRIIMASDVFKQSNDIEKLNISYRLINSAYGIGTFPFFGLGKTQKLPEKTSQT